MAEFFVHATMTGPWRHGHVGLAQFTQHLQQDWPAAKLYTPSSPADPWELRWELATAHGSLSGRRFLACYGLHLLGERIDCLALAAWYLAIVPGPQRWGPTGLTIIEIDGVRRRQVDIPVGTAASAIDDALAQRRWQRQKSQPAATYDISTIHTGTWLEGVLAPDVFAARLEETWPDAQTTLTHDPHNPWVLTWEVRVGDEPLRGWLGKEYHRLKCHGSLPASAAFACWYRQLIEPQYRLAFAEPSLVIYIELLPESTPPLLVEHVRWLPHLPAREQRRYRTPMPAVITGAHLGKLPDGAPVAYARLCAVVVSPEDDVWFTDTVRLLHYHKDRWLAYPSAADGVVAGPFAWFQGRLWAGSADGIAVLEAKTWRLFDASSALGSVTALATLRDETLWASSIAEGLWRSDDGRHWERVPSPIPDTLCGGVLVDGDTVWTTAYRAYTPIALLAWRDGAWSEFPPPPVRRFGMPTGIIAEDDDQLWLGSFGEGLWHYQDNQWSRVEARDRSGRRLCGWGIAGVARDVHGRLWVASYDGLAVRVDGQWRWAVLAPVASLDPGVLPFTWLSHAGSFHLDAKGRLWLATSSHELAWLDTTAPLMTDLAGVELVPYTPEPITAERVAAETASSVQLSSVQPVEEPSGPPAHAQPRPNDPEDLWELWPSRGPSPAPSAQMQWVSVARRPTGAGVTSVIAFAHTSDRLLWVSCAPGGNLFRQTEAGWESVELPGTRHTALHCIAYRHQLYVLDAGGRMAVHTGGEWKVLSPGDWLGANAYNACVDPAGRLWFATARLGLRFTDDGETWGQIDLPAPMLVGPLWSSGEGTLWLSPLGKVSAGAPLWRFCNDVWEAVPLPTKRTTVVFRIAGQDNGDLWVSTSLGLYRWRAETWEHIRIARAGGAAGPPGRVGEGPWVDAAQRVWFLTERGVAVYTGERWHVVSAQCEDSGSVRLLRAGGLPRGAHLDSDGRLWAVTTDGEIGYLDTREPLELI